MAFFFCNSSALSHQVSVKHLSEDVNSFGVLSSPKKVYDFGGLEVKIKPYYVNSFQEGYKIFVSYREPLRIMVPIKRSKTIRASIRQCVASKTNLIASIVTPSKTSGAKFKVFANISCVKDPIYDIVLPKLDLVIKSNRSVQDIKNLYVAQTGKAFQFEPQIGKTIISRANRRNNLKKAYAAYKVIGFISTLVSVRKLYKKIKGSRPSRVNKSKGSPKAVMLRYLFQVVLGEVTSKVVDSVFQKALKSKYFKDKQVVVTNWRITCNRCGDVSLIKGPLTPGKVISCKSGHQAKISRP